MVEGVVFRPNMISMTPLKIESYCYIHPFWSKFTQCVANLAKIIISGEKNGFLGIKSQATNLPKTFLPYSESLSLQLSGPKKIFKIGVGAPC